MVSGPPSLRTGQAVLPHPALQSVVLPQRGLTGLNLPGAERPSRPVRKAAASRHPKHWIVNMQNVKIIPSSPALARTVPRGLARRHSLRGDLVRPIRSTSTFLRSLRSRPVTALPRYYGRSDSCPPYSGSWVSPIAGSTCGQVSLIHVPSLPTLPSPTTPVAPTSFCHATLQLVGLPPVPRRSGLRHWLAGSPHTIGRIEFVILRTGRSPPVASHPASRRDLALQRDRSYVRFQAGERMPEEDFHLSDRTRFQAH